MSLLPFYGMFNIALGLIFLLIIPFMLHVAKQNYTEKLRVGFGSILFGVILCLIIGLYYIVYGVLGYLHAMSLEGLGYTPTQILQGVQENFFMNGVFSYPIGSYVLFAMLFFLVAIGIFAILERSKPEPDLKAFYTASNKLDLELSRKVFHIALLGVIVCYIIVGEVVVTGIYGHLSKIYALDNFPGNFIPYYDFNLTSFVNYSGQQMTLFILMAIFFLFLFTDFVRLYKPKYYLLRTVSTTWRETERTTFGPHVYQILGILIPVLFFRPPIAAAAIAISALGDASATIVGVTKGKRKLRASSAKTWEGCLAGFIGSFVFGFLCYFAVIGLASVYGSTYEGTVVGGLIISLGGALTFLILDYSTPPISDNLLNPVFCGLVMFLISLVII